jgi:RND family efflux transporter MFP subunit
MSRQTEPKSKFRSTCLGAALLAAGAFFLAACGAREPLPDAGNPPLGVRVALPHRIRERQTISVSGSVVSPDNPSNVSFLVSGKVQEVGPREGDFVKAGQALAKISPEDSMLALAAASAQVAAARAALQKASVPARPELLEQARIAYQRAEDELRRMQMLYDAKSLPANDFQKFQAAFEASRQQYEMAKAGAQKEDRDQAQAALNQALAAERITQKHLDDTVLLAPVDGFISARMVEPGETASPARPAFQIVSLDPVEISVGVPETDIHEVGAGQSAEIRIPAIPDQLFRGTVRIINISADPSTRTYMVRLNVPNPSHILRLGMVAEVKITGDREIDAMALTGDAIVRDSKGAAIVYVYYPDQKRVYAKRVEIGTAYGTEIQIRSGLSGDEQVVIAGQDRLHEGAEVAPVSKPPAAGPGRK